MRLKSRELPFIKFIYLLDLATSQVLESIGNREISLISRLNIALVYIIFSYRKEREKASEGSLQPSSATMPKAEQITRRQRGREEEHHKMSSGHPSCHGRFEVQKKTSSGALQRCQPSNIAWS